MSGKRSAATLLTVVVCGALLGGAALAGCTGAPSPTDAKTPDTGANAPATTSQVKVGANGVSHIADWGEVYPLQTQSFLDGANNIEERDYDNRSHSHALLAEEMEAFVPNATYEVRCGGCHFSWFKEITDAHGTSTEVLDSPMASYQDEFPDMEFWDCRTCHADDPANTLEPWNETFKAVSKSYTFPVEDTVCGQCHAATSENLWETDWDAIDSYRNGVSAYGLFQTFLESEQEGMSKPVVDGEGGYITKYDEETGLKYYGGGSVVDLENFQGSNHQNLGMTCASCHMPQTTAEDGTVYTSHDASGSPLENPVALDYCLTCHKGQGIETREAMKEFVLGKEEELAEGQLWMRENLEVLKSDIADAIKSGNVDEATLDEARMAWSKGSWYLRYTYGHEGENVGKKAAHNFDQMMDLMQQGRKIVQDAIDSLA